MSPMQIFSNIHHPAIAPHCALTIGNFDGVHRGHQEILSRLVKKAKSRQLAATVLTFEPHPIEFFAPDKAPARITKLRDKLCALKHCGIDQVIVLRFNEKLASLCPEAFIHEILSQGLHAQHIMVGDDFRFGKARQGDFNLLQQLSSTYNYTVEDMHTYEFEGQRVSSSLIRQTLAYGRMDLACEQLARPYAISGHVSHGRALGRNLGFPTLNIHFNHPKPAASGVFVARIIGLQKQPLTGVASLGIRPTVDQNKQVVLETHVFDWHGDAYGKLVRIELLKKLRGEVKFQNLEELKTAIAKDCDLARAYWHQRHNRGTLTP